jgi:protein-S-isoprenylcysteine O-methyltransferase Ste14
MNFLIQRIKLDLQFSRIFLCDFLAASAYAVATVYMLHEVALTVDARIEMGVLAFLILAAQAVQIAGVILLEKRGGDAREFAGSQTLITDGAYAFSRNPVYLVALLQSGLWSLLLLRGALLAPVSLVLILAATLIPAGHFLSIDRLVVPKEEAALRSVHPEAFAAYTRRVNRWFGRRDVVGLRKR